MSNSINPDLSEGDSLPLTTSFADVDWVAGTPTSVSYRLDCATTGQTITDWSSLTPGVTVSLTISSTENAILDDSNKRERKVLAIKAIDSGGNQHTETFKYWVRNLQGVT